MNRRGRQQPALRAREGLSLLSTGWHVLEMAAQLLSSDPRQHQAAAQTLRAATGLPTGSAPLKPEAEGSVRRTAEGAVSQGPCGDSGYVCACCIPGHDGAPSQGYPYAWSPRKGEGWPWPGQDLASEALGEGSRCANEKLLPGALPPATPGVREGLGGAGRGSGCTPCSAFSIWASSAYGLSSFLSSLGLEDELDCTSVCAMCMGVSPLDVRVLPQTKLITSSVPCPPAELEVLAAGGGRWRLCVLAPAVTAQGGAGRPRRSRCPVLDVPSCSQPFHRHRGDLPDAGDRAPQP